MEMQGASDYFLDSADRIHFFIEKDAGDEDGKIKPSMSKARSLNKVGHGLHVAVCAPDGRCFRKFTHQLRGRSCVPGVQPIQQGLGSCCSVRKEPCV
ncbi:unnamed protein product [Symbiodinium natans]|uniref:Uncharacterized protein n=1 Tax=Symbiodinium natans TaxID=878477 RepID=A0A812RQ72_9DINO|nr:unnamed protein product [Symbiodinium natans]